MRFRREKTLIVVVHLHDAYRLGDMFHLALFACVFLGYRLGSTIAHFTAQVAQVKMLVRGSAVNGCLGSSCTSALGSIGHEREDKPFKTVNAILHVIRIRRRGRAGRALLAVARRGIRT